MKTSKLLPEECQEEILHKLRELQSEIGIAFQKTLPARKIRYKVEVLQWVLEQDKDGSTEVKP